MRAPALLPLVFAFALVACADEGSTTAPAPPDTAAAEERGRSPRAEAAAPDTTPDAAPAAPTTEAGETGDGAANLTGPAWTIGAAEGRGTAAGVVTLRGVRVARHEGYDRIVFDFEGGLPGYHTEYIDKPVRQCGSGDTVALAGDGWLEVRFSDARAHTEAGAPTVEARRRAPGLPAVRALTLTCDFEAVVTWVAGVASPNAFRVLELSEPPRLVVDVRHE